jgi:hypothetical protein
MGPFAKAVAALAEGRGVAIVEVLADARTLVDRLRSARSLTTAQRAEAAAVVEQTASQLKMYWRGQPLVDVALRAATDPRLGLAFVPTVVRAVRDGAGWSVADVHRAIEGLAQVGEIELRPEAGTEFASAEDLALAPPGPRGTRLTRARRLR